MKLEQILEGAIGQRGKFKGYLPPDINGEIKKDATYEYHHINWPEHYEGKNTYGLSPVKIIQNENGSKGLCRWFGFDMDIEMEPDKFCKAVFKIAYELFCYRSSGGRWHLHYYLDDFIDVAEARAKALEIEKKLLAVFGGGDKKKGVDTGHTVPKNYTIEKNKPGAWLFMPYSKNKELKNNNLVCYSPRGNPLSKAQVEFRHTWRKHPLIVSSVGTTSGTGGREPMLFGLGMYLKHTPLDLTLDEINKNFNEPGSEIEFEKWKKGIEKSLANEEYTKQYLVDHHEKYLNDINGFWRKPPNGVGVLDGFIDKELEEKQNEFFEDTIYIKLDDRWYSKKTGKEYKEKTIKVTNGHLFIEKGNTDVIRAFSKDEHRKQEVEMGVYRPDLWKSNDDPIVIDEDGLKQLNQYRPGGPEAMKADTPERKIELQLFKDLIRKLTEHEKFGFTATGEKRPLYDYVLDHLSMPFQRRGVKVRSSIVMHSVENQVGKSTLFEIVETGLGKDNCIVITPENACRREKAFLPHQLVLIDELLIDGDYKKRISVLNVLKPLMTADKHDCRPLFKESRQIYSTCSFMCFTNHKDAVAIKEFDARYTCIDVNKNREQMGGDEFFHKIWNLDGTLKGTIVNVVKHFLSTRKISATFDPAGISLDTEFRKTMSEHGGHPMFPEVKTRLNERSKPFDQSIISISDAHTYLKKEERVKGSLNELSEALEKLGCIKIGECKHGRTGKHPIMYIVRNKEFFDGMTNVEIINNYWLPTDCNSQSLGSETWNLSQGDLSDIRKHLIEIEKYEELMEKEEAPKVVRIEGGEYSKTVKEGVKNAE